ncbi:hypothetical protein ElyMa_006820300 [Elysia marginata]|uniref:G-protein coupled receptors family 1 profile domain-containing protein n=1 Tax=Elysia marginata TaxID=1093978 RepID=A0AAV4J3N2_9GAST|nr:hypothetical protein ElyMa_006820300 [Elysia marginata]
MVKPEQKGTVPADIVQSIKKQLTWTAVPPTRRLNPHRNETLLYVYYDNNELNVFNRFAFTLYGGIYPVVSWTLVTLCTVFLVVKLRQSARWFQRTTCATRADTTVGQGHGINKGPGYSIKKCQGQDTSIGLDHNNSKDQRQSADKAQGHHVTDLGRKRSAQATRVTKTVVTLASLFMLFSLPSSVNIILASALREYSISGSLSFLFFLMGQISLLLNELNSAVNLLVFTATMPNFRAALLQIFSNSRL